MEKLNILVTGASGFIGRSFLKRLNRNHYNVYALSHKIPPDFELAGIKNFYQQDITQGFHLEQEFDFIYHFAAYNVTHVGSKDSQRYEDVNVKGTENLLKAVRAKNFVFLSTAKVYKQEGNPWTENSPLGPETDYARSKLKAEEVCQKKFQGDRLIVFRSVNIVGPEQRMKAVIPVFFQKAVSGLPLEVIVPKNQILQMLFVEDAVKLFFSILEDKRISGIFNLASSEHISVEDLARKIVRQCNSRSPIKFINNEPSLYSEVNFEKLKKASEWRPKTTIADILKIYHQNLLSVS